MCQVCAWLIVELWLFVKGFCFSFSFAPIVLDTQMGLSCQLLQGAIVNEWILIRLAF